MDVGGQCKYSKTYVKRPLSKRLKIGFQYQLWLNAGQSIAECSKGSILQYFQPSLSYHLSLRSLFCLFYTGFTVNVCTKYLISWPKHRIEDLPEPNDKITLSNQEQTTSINTQLINQLINQ